MRRIFCRSFLLFVLPLVCLQFASAQSGVDINLGFGAATAPAAKTGIDQNLASCPLGTSGCTATPSLSAFMLTPGVDLMLWKRFGVGFDAAIQPAKKQYVDLTSQAAGLGLTSFSIQSRTTIYDINGILQPYKAKRAAFKLYGGIGGMNLKFYESGSQSTALTGSQSFSQVFGSSNHFQVHGGVGLQLYPGEKWFIRPQVDVNYVTNLTQFGRNAVLRYSIFIGYTLGQ